MFRPLRPPAPIVLVLALLLVPFAGAARATSDDEPFPAAPPASVGISDEVIDGLVAAVQGYVDAGMAVGAELLVIQDRRTVLHEVFGSIDVEDDDEPWTAGTVCNIRSMTKTLTGAAAQILIDRGQLALDDPVAKYLPGFDTDAARDITVRQLLTHRSGLPLTLLRTMDEHASLFELGNAAGEAGPEYEPDSRFWYSDAGSEALGAVVEVASGRKLDAFVHDELLVPLGMSESFYFLDDDDPRRSRIASLYFGSANNWTRFLDPDDGAFYPFAWGSQSLYSTPRDYARFLAMWMDGGRVGESVVLSPEAVERTLTPVSEMTMLGSDARFPTSYTGLEVYYGQMSVLHVPLVAKGEGPAIIIGHSGSDGTIAWAWPDLDLMILYFTQSRGGGTALRLEEVIDRLLISPGAYVYADAPPELQPFLGTYIADWATHRHEEFVVDHRNGRFVLDVPSQMVFELLPKEGATDRWVFSIAPAIEVFFERDDDGVVDCLRITQAPLTFEAPRKGTPHLVEFEEANRLDALLVAKYLGTYHDPEEDTDFEVLIDDDDLAARTSEGVVFHLWKVPIGEDIWQVRENPIMQITFQEEDGRVVSLTRNSAYGDPVVMPRVDASG